MKVLLDVDGPLCDYVGGYNELLNKYTGKKYTVDQYNHWEYQTALGLTEEEAKELRRLQAQPGWVRSLSCVIGSYEGVTELEKRGYEIVFVTSPPNWHPTWVYERSQWLSERWPGRSVIHTKDKHHVEGFVAIDDKPENLEAWEDSAAITRGLLWDLHHNQDTDRFIRVKNWKEVVEQVEEAYNNA